MKNFIIESKWRILIPTILYLLFTILNASYDYDALEVYQWAPHVSGVLQCLLAGFSRNHRFLVVAVCYINLMVVVFFIIRHTI